MLEWNLEGIQTFESCSSTKSKLFFIFLPNDALRKEKKKRLGKKVTLQSFHQEALGV